MSQDKSSKTEEPTQKRLEDSQKKGEIASSQEITTWFAFLAIALFLSWGGEFLGAKGAVKLRSFFSPHMFSDIWLLSKSALLETVITLSVVMLALSVFGIISRFVQSKPVISLEPMEPKLSKLNPVNGLKKIFSSRGIVNLVKSKIKVAIIGGVFFFLLGDSFVRELPFVTKMPLEGILTYVVAICSKLILWVLSILGFVAVADFLYEKYKYKKDRRMSHQDIKDEYKATQGDPQVKGRLASMRRERAAAVTAGGLQNATVVVTNPTHLALAISYVPGFLDVPIVVAKGGDTMAEHIKSFAKKNSIPLVEDKPLARALYRTCNVGNEIPSKYYKAVAKIIAYVMNQRR